MDAPYGKVEQLGRGIRRILAHNPSAFTYYGTQSYLVGTNEVAVIDPGPDLPEHIEMLVRAISDRRVAAILCTHTHLDHSPASRSLAERTGAPIIGCGPLALKARGPRADASFDADYSPQHVLADAETIDVDGLPLVAVATPGHTSNHLCFSYGDALFSGDHVMGWSTTVVFPPDGDMAAYRASLEKLRHRDERIYYPAHGPPITNPSRYLRQLMAHRKQRESQILQLVRDETRNVPDIVANAYPGLDPRLTIAAGGSVLAHLLDLERRGLVKQQHDQWKAV
ncbi:MAG TPA: MBL fold metallo-hydrolase [Sphingomicrobium sp.]|nr:MBL fold metallo-hydrolase [Sphingomicrobium sp.]